MDENLWRHGFTFPTEKTPQHYSAQNGNIDGLRKVLGQAGPVALFVNLPKPRFVSQRQLKGKD